MSSSYDRLSDDSAHASVAAADQQNQHQHQRQHRHDQQQRQQRPDEATRSWTFAWLADLLALAERRPLEQGDSPPLPAKCTTKYNAHLLSEHWTQSSASSSQVNNTFRLAWAIWRVWGWEYMGTGVWLAGASIVGFAGPMLLHALVQCAENRAPPLLVAFYITSLFLSKVAVSLMSTRYSFNSSLLSVAIGSAIKGCLFQKTLKLSTLARQQYSAGNITNLYTVDIERVVGLAVVLHNFWSLPLQIFVAMALLWQVVSYAMLAGLASIIVILLVNNYISVLQKRANDLIMTAKDERMKVTAECFGAMLIIKLNAWEPKFQQKILDCRQEELKHIWTMLFVSAFNICLLWMAPCVVAVSTILTYSQVMRADITAAEVFTALSLFRMLQDPLRNLPGNITQLFQAMSSLQRLQKFHDMFDKDEELLQLQLRQQGADDRDKDKNPLHSHSYADSDQDIPDSVRGLVEIRSSLLVWSSDLPFTHSPPAMLVPSRRQRFFVALNSIRRVLAPWLGRPVSSFGSSSGRSGSDGGSGAGGIRSANAGAAGESASLEMIVEARNKGLVSSISTDSLDDSSSSSHPLAASRDDDDDDDDNDSRRRDVEEGAIAEADDQAEGSVQTVSFGPALPKSPSSSNSSSSSSSSSIGRFLLRLPQLTLRPGQLAVIHGIVGGGKSSTIHALLGEMYPLRPDLDSPNSFRSATTHGTLAYASQQPWIRNASIRDNILFGLAFDDVAYARTVDACCLEQDFVELPFGEMTHIGEKGVNLSGGQKARIALARAVYADADVYLLDDVLAALDSIVARKVFDRCVLGLLRGKTRILITHSEDVIASAAVDVLLGATDGMVVVERGGTADVVGASVGVVGSGVVSIRRVPYELRGRAQPSPRTSDLPSSSSSSSSSSAPATDAHDAGPEASTVVIERNHSYSGRTVVKDEDADADGAGSPKHSSAADATAAATASYISTGSVDVGGEQQEERAQGNVDQRVYLSYMNAMGGWRVVVFLLCVQTVWQALSVGSDLYLSHWTRQSDADQKSHAASNALIYAALSLGSGSIVLVRTMTVSTTGYRAAKSMFENMLNSLLHAPMSWLDKNPSGRLLNRLSDDQAKVDCSLPFAVGSVFATFFSVGGDLLTVMVITRYLIVLSLPVFWAYRRVMSTYLKASREIQRLQSISQSPVLTSMSELIAGVVTVRAFGEPTIRRIIARNEQLLDANGTMSFLASATSSWFVLRIQLVGAFILLLISSLVFLLGDAFLPPGLVGLSISYGLSISNGLQGAVMILSWFENSMVCPERIQQYIDVKPEGTEEQRELFQRAPECARGDGDKGSHGSSGGGGGGGGDGGSELDSELPPLTATSAATVTASDRWPWRGSITFKDVCFSYQPTSDLVLDRLSFHIRAGEKIGVVGRTGSGKSSLAMSLFRIAELASGTISIDGVDVSRVSLADLRGAVEIIPQNPVLFKGSLRSYVDPFDEFSDEDVWAALVKAQMSDSVKRLYCGSEHERAKTADSAASQPAAAASGPYKYLYAQVSDSGDNLSIGERQMLVMSRALLRGARILVMDEATASLDHQTDAKLQRVLRDSFRDTTTLTIAHRIDTILASDRILVMANGSVQEFAEPGDLLRRPDSLFRALAVSAGVPVPALD